MKVIVAGYSKTGTKTMNAALTELGYNVYDNVEHYVFLFEEWRRIFDGKGTVEDFKSMYKNVDAVTDYPANVYWKEIHEAFPDAKIILTTRDEESWYKSLVSQCEEGNKDSLKFLSGITTHLMPFAKRAMVFANEFALDVTGRPMKKDLLAHRTVPDPMLAKQRYRKHNAFVLQEVPKEQLLVFNVQQGWEPLCKFLGKEIPEKLFPWKNIGGKAYVPEHFMRQFERQALKELFLVLLVFLAIIVSVYFFVHDYDWWKTFSLLLFGISTWHFFLKI